MIIHLVLEEAILATMRVDEFLALARDRIITGGKELLSTLNSKE